MLTANFFDSQTNPGAVEKPILLVCGYFGVIPDKPFKIHEINNLKDFVSLPLGEAGTLLSVPEESVKVLQAYESYPELFDFQLVVMTGVPECVYSGQFEVFTAFCPKLSYSQAIAELESEAIREAALAAEKREGESIYDGEVRRRTRSSGHVKEFTSFTAPTMSGLAPSQDSEAADDYS